MWSPPAHRATCARAAGRHARPGFALRCRAFFTFVDLGPRLVVVTHHNAIAGPYHRNGDAILDVQHAFSGSAEQFSAIAKRHGFLATSLISGIIWALWHYPILLLGTYRSATPVWYYLPLFTVTVTTINFLWTWMRLKSGSIWPCVFLHAAHNTFFQRFFDPLTVYNNKTPYVAGEFGAGLTVVSILIAVYYWRRRDELEASPLLPRGRVAAQG